MLDHAKYLAFGLLVLAGYWYTVSRGVVFFDADESPSGRAAAGASSRSHPSFWSTGFHGGK
ncbi:MAG: hypothetical protein JWN04_3670 [Myxococcaceae bacterium]|nr:hypothetical protein [Myxococcaceae bacterium]